MRVVVLDGYPANAGDLSWESLAALGECVIHEHTPAAETVARARGAQALITNKTVLDAATLEQLDGLAYVGVLATGHDVVDVSAARRLGVVVTNVPAYAAPSVAQHTVALLLELCNRVGHHSAAVREGRWCACRDYSFWDFPLRELAGQTMGIVGLGRIGRAVAGVARALGMQVVACTRSPAAVEGVRCVSLAELLAQSDVVSLHCPLTDETRGLIHAARLAAMKPTALLLHTSRGALVDEQALADALNAGRLAGAGLDVLSAEPPRADNPLLSARNCLITPHQAWAAKASRARLLSIAVDNLRAFLAGRPQNVVS